MNVKEIINYGIKELKENKVEESNIKAKILLQYILKKDKEYLLVHDQEVLSEIEEIHYKECIKEMIKGKPIQYITNNQEFMKLNFYVDENVLIPQPDTEILVENAINELSKITNNDNVIKVLDLCTGSGAIAISIGKYAIKNNLKIKIYASDISKNALKIAKKNIDKHQVEIDLIESDMFENIEEKFDIIVSNPPYIESETIKKLSNEVQNEPYIALNGGKDGLDFYRIISKNIEKHSNKKGILLLEIGYNQREAVSKILKDTNRKADISYIKDLSGNDRVIKFINN